MNVRHDEDENPRVNGQQADYGLILQVHAGMMNMYA